MWADYLDCTGIAAILSAKTYLMDNLTSKTAVITGAGSGIGRQLALRSAAEGMHVVVADIEVPPMEETAALIAEVGGGGEKALCVQTDVTDAKSVQALADTAFGWRDGVHLLCNNAGVFVGGLMWERTIADWEWVMAVNVFGIVHAVDAFVPRMLEQDEEAHIVNTSSMGGMVSASFSGPYFTSKFAAVGLSECLAHDLAAVEAKIGVSVLVPSLISTNIGSSTRNRQEAFANTPGHETSDSGRSIEEVLVISVAEAGLDPAVAADKVFAGVKAGDFYIPTNDTYDTQIQMRYEDILTRQLPRVPPID